MKGVVAGRGTVPVLALVLLLLAAVAASSRTRIFHEGEPPVSVALSRLAVDFSAYLFFALLLVACAVIGWALWPREMDGPEPPRRTLRSLVVQMLATAFLLGVTVLLLVRFRLVRLAGQGAPAQPGRAAVNPYSALTSAVPNTPAGFDWAAAALVLLTLAVSGAVLARRLRRSGRALAERRALRQALEEVVEETLDDLRLDADPRRAVIQAYARMERVLGLHGAGRRAPEAPLEYLARVLRELRVPAPAAHRLTDLFEEARFSRHPVSGGMRDEAVGCLERVRAALAG